METIIIKKAPEITNPEMETVYKHSFPRVARFVKDMGGSFDDARDIFHDALVLFIEARSKNEFVLQTSEGAYILGISKHLWSRRNKKGVNSVYFSDMDKEMTVPSDYYPSVENQRLLRFLKASGKKCLDLLRSFYYQPSNLKELATTLGYPNEHAASVQKYKCLVKIRESIKQRSLMYEDFLK